MHGTDLIPREAGAGESIPYPEARLAASVLVGASYAILRANSAVFGYDGMHYQELYSLVQAPLAWLRGALRHEPFKAIVLRGTRTATPSGTKRSDGEVQLQQTRENRPEPDVVLAVALTRAD